uniref:Uncharacterized protein n=1 Tax=Anguilla anguilla TaxID=7936 RepID=A0A0E9U7P2_ANGAN
MYVFTGEGFQIDMLGAVRSQ